ncbi:NADH-quinone oxidoreductase subunit NuoH [Phenylobacterium sp.]|uniref:NADH-quinone oxidoreductase subunit NuoH n=1 Tax=Phenylobacterium sp. TaxID=1871053 RepID=UPI0039833586
MTTVTSFWTSPVGWSLLHVGQILLVTVVLLLTVAFIIYGDRKIFAGVQMRKGPNVVGPFGLLQSFADLGKFLIKELVIPSGADKIVFLLAPLISVTLALGAWAAMPLAPGWVISDINVGVLYLFAISSLGVYGIIMGGWASNSKYPFLGALRSAAQMVSYEVSIGFVIITVILLSGTMNLTRIVELQAGGFWNWNILGGAGLANLPLALVMIPMGVIFFISSLAETNRPPFDLPEAESELVAGYAVEYGSTPYMLFYLAETANIVLMCGLMAVLFLGGWQAPFPTPFTDSWPATLVSLFGLMWLMAKTIFVFFMNAMVRAIVPRYRYDQLMRLGWKVFLPTSLVAVALVAGWRVYGPLA